jgi:hypothetical protein
MAGQVGHPLSQKDFGRAKGGFQNPGFGPGKGLFFKKNRSADNADSLHFHSPFLGRPLYFTAIFPKVEKKLAIHFNLMYKNASEVVSEQDVWTRKNKNRTHTLKLRVRFFLWGPDRPLQLKSKKRGGVLYWPLVE